MSDANQKLLGQVRRLIEAWPETAEKLSHGSPTWWGGKKTFASFHSGGYDEGRPGIWFKAPVGAQEVLIAEDGERYYRPKYLGPSGWVAYRLVEPIDWSEVRLRLLEGYATVAPKRALAQLSDEDRTALELE